MEPRLLAPYRKYGLSALGRSVFAYQRWNMGAEPANTKNGPPIVEAITESCQMVGSCSGLGIQLSGIASGSTTVKMQSRIICTMDCTRTLKNFVVAWAYA